MQPKESDLIYDWNRASGQELRPGRGRVELNDETLRDGLQSPSVKNPPIEDKVRMLHLMADLGLDSANLGLPGAGAHVAELRPALCHRLPGNAEGDAAEVHVRARRIRTTAAAAAWLGTTPFPAQRN